MSFPWISDPGPADYLDAAEAGWQEEILQVAAVYPDAHLVPIVPGTAYFYAIEAEHEDYLLRFADAETGHLNRESVQTWEVVVCDEDGDEVHTASGESLTRLVLEARGWCLARVDEDRVAQADDPDRDHDSKEA